MTLGIVALVVLAALLLAGGLGVGAPLPGCIDRLFLVIVDPNTGRPAIVTPAGALTVTGSITVTETVVPITQANNGQVTIAGSTQILAANANRKRFWIVNIDATRTVYLMFGGGAATIVKFPLLPQTYVDSDNGPFIPQEAIFGIESGGAPVIGFAEWV